MKVKIVKPFGYCNGVKKAIDLALKTKEKNTTVPVYIFGNLVHNRFVRDVLQEQGIQTIDRSSDLSLLPSGIMITTAHGISKEAIQAIIDHGFIHIDATCPLVYKSFTSIKKSVANNKIVLYFGNKQHPEAIAASAIDPKRILIFENLDDLKNLDYSKEYVLTNQTTIRHEDLQKYFIYLLNLKYKVDLLDEICNATKLRQTALKKALTNDWFDIVFIIGDTTSNNSNQLYSIAKDMHHHAFFIASYKDIQPEWLKDKKSALLCSGASTPNILVEQVAYFLKENDMSSFPINNKKIIQG